MHRSPANRFDLTGTWQVTHIVETSQRADFVDLEIGFELGLLESSDGQIAGGGEKSLVDKEPVDAAEVSYLEFTGWVHESEVQISLVESAWGGERTINGQISWQAESPDRMLGTFRVDLAETSGRSEAHRL